MLPKGGGARGTILEGERGPARGRQLWYIVGIYCALVLWNWNKSLADYFTVGDMDYSPMLCCPRRIRTTIVFLWFICVRCVGVGCRRNGELVLFVMSIVIMRPKQKLVFFVVIRAWENFKIFDHSKNVYSLVIILKTQIDSWALHNRSSLFYKQDNLIFFFWTQYII